MNFNYDTGTVSVLQYLDPTVAAPLNGALPTNVLFINGPGALSLPDGTTAERPVLDSVANPSATGMFRYNSDIAGLEYFNGLNWLTLSYAAGSVTSFSAGITGFTPSSATTGAVTLSGTLNLASGGTNSNLTASAGSIAYSTASGLALNAVGTSGYLLISTGTGTPIWTNPATTLVTSVIAGSGISVSAATGAVTISNTGVTSFSAGITGFTPSSATTGAVTLSGTLNLASGGTNSSNTGSNGSIIYNNGTSIVNSSVGLNNQALISSGAGAPLWLSVSSTVTANQIIQGNGAGDFAANGATFTGTGSFSGVTLNGVVTNANDAVTKAYADALIQGLSFKQAARAATSVPGTIATSFANGQVIDGVTLVTGDRILIKNQTTQSENGIYVVNATGAPTRSFDASTGSELVGAYVFVDEGTLFADTSFAQITPSPIVIGTSNIVWTQFTGAGTYTNGAGLALLGGQFSVKTDGVTTHIDGGSNVAVLSSSTLDQILLSQGTGNTALWGALPLNNSNAVTGILGLTNGGTGTNLTNIPGAIVYGGVSGMLYTSVGTTGQVLVSSGTGTPVWQNFSADAVTTFQTSLSGLTPQTPTMGAVTLAGTLGPSSGGTGSTLIPGNGQILIGNGTSYTTATLGTSTGISTTTGIGTLTINNTGVTSITGTTNQIDTSSATGSVTISFPNSYMEIPTSLVRIDNQLQIISNTPNSFLYSDNSDIVLSTAATANGELLIGSASGPIKNTLTAGTAISVTNGVGSITIANTGVTNVSFNGVTAADTNVFTFSPTTASTGAVAETLTLNTQNSNLVFMGPVTGAPAQPTFRSLSYADLPLRLYVENPLTPTTPVVTGTNSIAIGSGSVATANNSFALGNGANTYMPGGSNFSSGKFTVSGDAQGGAYVLRNQTTDATANIPLYLDGASALMIFPLNSCVTFDILVVALRTDGTTAGAGYRFVGATVKGVSQASVAIIGSVSKTVIGETVVAWDARCVADTSTGAIQIQVTGSVATPINWVATVRTTEAKF